MKIHFRLAAKITLQYKSVLHTGSGKGLTENGQMGLHQNERQLGLEELSRTLLETPCANRWEEFQKSYILFRN